MSEARSGERHYLDARGLLCPMPVIRTEERVGKLAPGDVLEVHASDPGALHDIPAWCRVNGHTVLDTAEDGDELMVTLQVGGEDDGT